MQPWRVCWECGEGYPLAPQYFEMVRQTRVKPYFRHYCRACWKKRYVVEPEKQRQRNRDYYLNNRERILERIKKRRLESILANRNIPFIRSN